jgi:hypothetical protein
MTSAYRIDQVGSLTVEMMMIHPIPCAGSHGQQRTEDMEL